MATKAEKNYNLDPDDGSLDEIILYFGTFGTRTIRKGLLLPPEGDKAIITANISALSSKQQLVARDAFEAWDLLIPQKITIVPSDDADIIFLPGKSGTAHVEHEDTSVPGMSRALVYMDPDHVHLFTYIHELGHAFGFSHPGAYEHSTDDRPISHSDEGIFANDSKLVTVMSYFNPPDPPNIPASHLDPVTPQIADIVAIQLRYGQPESVNEGDTTYGVNADTGTYMDKYWGEFTKPDRREYTGQFSITIYDTDGYDTLDFSNETATNPGEAEITRLFEFQPGQTHQYVNLNPGWTSSVYGRISNLVIARDTIIERYFAGAGNDHVTGNVADNWLEGRDGDDTLLGGSGDDVLEGGRGADHLDGQAGQDQAAYRASPEAVMINLATGTVSGGHASGDTLVSIEGLMGSRYADRLVGNAGDNVLEGGGGADYLDGGAGRDQAAYTGSPEAVTVNLATGTVSGGHTSGDTLVSIEGIIGSAYGDILTGDAGPNVLEGHAGADRLSGHGGDDTASYARSDTGVIVRLHDQSALYGHAQGDVFAGMVVVPYRTAGGVSATDNLPDIENLVGSAHDDVLAGDRRDNRLDGGAGNDMLYGGPDNDVLMGGAGDDLLWGGPGADRLLGNDGHDTASYARSDTGVTVRLHDQSALYGHAQGDVFAGTVAVPYRTAGGVSATDNLPDIENLVGSAHDDVLAGDRRDNRLDGGVGNDTLYGGPGGGDDALQGGEGNDRLYGGAGNDKLDGGAGNDTLYGGPDNDVLMGGAGADILNGRGGLDTASYGSSTAGVTVDLQTGTRRGGDAEGDTLVSIENFKGSGYADVLTGDSGDNRLEGGAGADVLDGGDGQDTASYSSSTAGVRVDLQYGYNEGGDAEGDTLVNIENLEGSDYDDLLIGDSRDNLLSGGAGADGLRGGGGVDTLRGGKGNDVLEGGAGTDYLYGGADHDSLFGNAGDDWLHGGAGYDTFVFSFGENGADTIMDFNIGIDVLDLWGFDLDNLDDIDMTLGAEGVTIDLTTVGGGTILLAGLSSIPDSASFAFDQVYVDGDGDGDGDGDDDGDGARDIIGSRYNDILLGDGGDNRLEGRGGNDALYGEGGDDTLLGGDGNDTLHGGIGNDSLQGEAGNDVLYGGPGADTLTGRAGSDTAVYGGTNGVIVRLHVATPARGGHAQGDTLTGIEHLWGTNSDDVLAGDGGDNRLEGRGGNDTLYGGPQGGDDTLLGGHGNDILYGGKGNDVLDGGAGNDVLYGGPGADTLTGRAGSDTAVYGGTNGVIVRLHVATPARGGHAQGDTLTGIEHLWGTNSDDVLAGDGGDNRLEGRGGNDTLYGGPQGGDDTLLGGHGNDILYGGKGNDVLDGGAGNDVLYGGPGADTVVLAPGYGQDRVYGFDVGQGDRIDLSNFNLDGVARVAQSLGTGGLTIKVTASDGTLSTDMLLLDGFTTPLPDDAFIV